MSVFSACLSEYDGARYIHIYSELAKGFRTGGMFIFLTRLKRALNILRLSSTARQVRAERITYLIPAKLLRIEQALEKIEKDNVAGCVVEFGVALGGSAVLLAKYAKQNGRAFHGFDVFATIPPPTSEKDDEKSRERYEVIASGQSTGIDGDDYYGYKENLLDEVKATLDRYGATADGKSIRLHKGLFEDTVPGVDFGQIAFAHLDCDWYDPVIYCLQSIADSMSVGGLIILDDYHDYGGARTAVDEFLQDRNDFAFEAGANPALRKIK